jgi:hypothetical protein
MKLSGPTCTEALSGAEEAGSCERAGGSAGGVRVERRVRRLYTLNTPLTLNHKDASHSPWMGEMFAANLSEKHIAGLEGDHLFEAGFAVMHIYDSIKNGEDFLTIVDMPVVRCVCSVQLGGRPIHVGNVDGAPCTVSSEILASDDCHWVGLREASNDGVCMKARVLAVFPARANDGANRARLRRGAGRGRGSGWMRESERQWRRGPTGAEG